MGRGHRLRNGLLCLGCAYLLYQVASGMLSNEPTIANTPAILRPASASTGDGSPDTPASVSIRPCGDEMAFVQMISTYAQNYRAAANDMAKGSLRVERAKHIDEFIRKGRGHLTWIGTVAEVSSTSKGNGVLSIKLSDDGTLKVSTTNNDFSDTFGHHTVLEPNSPVWKQAVQLREGEPVLFDGVMFASKDDGAEEQSLTQEGAMTVPDFLMRFISVRPLTAGDAAMTPRCGGSE